jgi:ribosomal protein S18 acetylase RimI-like enzyme
MNIIIRPANASDVEAIAQFNQAMARETEHLELDRDRLLRGVKAVLENPSKGFYTVAEANGHVVGQMMITYEWSDWRNGAFWWIQSVYVHTDYRGAGVFRQLYRHIEERARNDAAVCGLRLYVEAENRVAQNTYQRLGLKPTSYQVYEIDFVISRL